LNRYQSTQPGARGCFSAFNPCGVNNNGSVKNYSVNNRGVNNRVFFCGVLIALLLGATATAAPPVKTTQPTVQPEIPPPVRPNILWIVADDLSPDLGCYGAQQVATPAINAMAAAGVRYDAAFATAPVCSSSRTAFITGMYQTSTGGHHHRTRSKKTLPQGIAPVTHYFQQAGYFTCNMKPPGVRGAAKQDYNFLPPEGMYDGDDWSQRRPGQPFFAQVQIHEPHRPFISDVKRQRVDHIKLPPQYPAHPVAKADWANYLATVEVLDNRVAAVMKRLQDEGLASNTVVMFFGDHGRPHVWGKQFLYEGGLRIPLIIQLPTTMQKVKAGSVNTQLVSMIDLAPTSLQLAGISPPRNMQGRDIFGSKPPVAVFAARDRCGDAVDRIRAVRTSRYKYIRNYLPHTPYTVLSGYKKLQYPVFTLMKVLHTRGRLTPVQQRFMQDNRPAEELYDLNNDPHELKNLASDNAYLAQLKTMRGLLSGWQKQAGDTGAQPEGDAAYFKKLMAEKQKYYRRTMQRRGLDPEISDEQYLTWWEKQLLKP